MTSEAVTGTEFTGGVFCQYRARVNPPWIRLEVTPERLAFRGRGLFRSAGPWRIPREHVRAVFAKKRSMLQPWEWHMVIVTDDPSIWWTFVSFRQPDPVLLALEECGYPVDWAPHNWAGSSVE